MLCNMWKVYVCDFLLCYVLSLPHILCRILRKELEELFQRLLINGLYKMQKTLWTNPKRKSLCYQLTKCTVCCKKICCNTRLMGM
uniref:Putative secreted protein n=1 Tax=Xenopsylla cheopis TaxID=163159 RepID=A0A6M2DWP1_XENCH